MTREKSILIYKLTCGKLFENDSARATATPIIVAGPCSSWPVLSIDPALHDLRTNAKWASRKNVFRGRIGGGHNLVMNDSGKMDHLRKLLNLRMAIVEVGIVETNEEAWLRHLATHPEDHYVDIRIFNLQKPGIESRNFEIKTPEKITKSY